MATEGEIEQFVPVERPLGVDAQVEKQFGSHEGCEDV
jgi:hypothetical protein